MIAVCFTGVAVALAIVVAQARSARPAIRTAQVTARDIRSVLRVTGRIVARKITEVKSPVSGQLVAYAVDEAAQVGAGATVATVRPDQSQALLLSQAMADERVKGVARAQALKELARAKGLFDSGILPASAYEVAAATAENATEAYELARKQVRILQGERGRGDVLGARSFAVTAPVSGTVLATLVSPGESVIGASNGVVSNGGTPLLRIADTSAFVVKIDVNEVDVANVKIGMPALVRPASGTRAYRAHVSRVAAEATTEKELTSFQTEVQIDEPAAFRHGMTADVDIILDERRGVAALPVSAVIRDGGNAFVVGQNGARTPVVVGVDDGDYVEIRRGLHTGDVVRSDASPRPLSGNQQ